MIVFIMIITHERSSVVYNTSVTIKQGIAMRTGEGVWFSEDETRRDGKVGK